MEGAEASATPVAGGAGGGGRASGGNRGSGRRRAFFVAAFFVTKQLAPAAAFGGNFLAPLIGAGSSAAWSPTPVPPQTGDPPHRTPDEEYELKWEYLADEKAWAHVGDPAWMAKFPVGSRKYYNSLATFPRPRPQRMHGDLGYFPNNGSAMFPYRAEPPDITKNETLQKEKLSAGGGFYLDLSDHLPLDRDPPDNRMGVCKAGDDYAKMDDASVVITFYNEPMSTLLRSVHAVLNRTPPPILREIILVDDHSNTTDSLPGEFLDQYIRLLPKVKVLRLPERRGLVWARMAGAQVARAPVLVVLDSHIEVNDGWLEPQLTRLRESPESIVFPQIAGIQTETFKHLRYEGIGCVVSFKWIMQERSMGMVYPESKAPIPSPNMAGGLFAVNLDWFWESGAYDEAFSMWGAENVEMGFRAWLCGGKVECTPCAITYHLYRHGGVGYKSPAPAIVRNRLRTARAWADDMFALSEAFINRPGFDMGPFDDLMDLQKKLHCRNFKYFLDKVDKLQPVRSLDNITFSGEVRNVKYENRCLDSLGHWNVGEKWGNFHCHGMGGTQAFLHISTTGHLHPASDESKCLDASNLQFARCPDDAKDGSLRWETAEDGRLRFRGQCLGATQAQGGAVEVGLAACNDADDGQRWKVTPFRKKPFVPIDHSEEYKQRMAKIDDLKAKQLYF